MIESAKPNHALREKLNSLQIRRRLLKTIAGAEIADRADAEDKARRALRKMEKSEEASSKAEQKRVQDEADDRRLFEIRNKLAAAWGEDNPDVQKFLQIAQGMRNGGYGPQTPAEKKLFLQGRSVLEPNNVRIKNELTSIIKNEQRIKDTKNKIKGFFSRTKGVQETSPEDVPQNSKSVPSKGDTPRATQADKVLKNALNAVDKGVDVDKLGESKRENALRQIAMLLKQNTNVTGEKDLEDWINRELLEVYGSDKKSRERAVQAIKQAVYNDAKGQYAKVARDWADKAKETLPNGADKQSADNAIDDAKNKIGEVIEDEQEQGRKDATDAFIKNMKGWDGKPIDVTKIDGWDEKKFNQVLGLLIKDINNTKALKDAKVWGRDVYDNLVFFAAQRSQEEKRNLEARLVQITEQVQELTAKLNSRDDEMDLLKQEVENLKSKAEEKSTADKAMPAGAGINLSNIGNPNIRIEIPGSQANPVPPQVGRGYENPPYPPQGAPWPPQYTQYQPPPASAPIFENNQSAPKHEPTATTQQPQSNKGTPDVIAMPPDPTFKETADAAKNPERVPFSIHADAIRAQGLSKFGLQESQYNKYKSLWGRFGGWFNDYATTAMTGYISSALATKTGLLTLAGIGTASAPALMIAVGAGIIGGMYGAHLRKEQRQERLQASAIRAVEKRAEQNKWRIGADATDIDKALDKTLVSKRRKEMLFNLVVGVGVGYANFATHHGDWKLESAFGEKWWSAIAEKFNGVHPPAASVDAHLAACGAANISDAPTLPPSIDTSVKSWDGPVASDGSLNITLADTPPSDAAVVATPSNEQLDAAPGISVAAPVAPEQAAEPIMPGAQNQPEPIIVQDAGDTADLVPVVSEVASQSFDFEQPVTNGGVWTAVEKVLEQAGIEPNEAGGTDVLTLVTDAFEDYIQDGTAPGTRATSYFRNLGQGLLDTMTGQQGATQVTIRNPIDTAHLFANEDIYKDVVRRLADNRFVDDSVLSIIENIHTAAKAALNQ